jgi:hypothetical protein
MPFIEVNESPVVYEENSNQRSVESIYNQRNCSYCYEQHVGNQVGTVSLKHNLWFCGPSCQCMYNYDNKLVQYTPELIRELESMRKKFYNPDVLKQRKRKLGFTY